MILICLACQGQRLPAFPREIEPYGDVRVVPTICVLHVEELTARLRALAAELRAQGRGRGGIVSVAASCTRCFGGHAASACPYSAGGGAGRQDGPEGASGGADG